MRLGLAGHQYEWIEEWAGLPDDDRIRHSWAHHALAVTGDGQVVGFHPADGLIVVYRPDGNVVRSFDCGVVEGHGLSIVNEGGHEFLWVADNGMKVVRNPDALYGYDVYAANPSGTQIVIAPDGAEIEVPVPCGRVFKVRLDDGAVVTELPKPDHALYAEFPYIPTAVAAMPDGTVWVADGYGASALHRFAPDGKLLRSLTGEESAAGRLNCPHGLLLDRRRGEPELYVADRENLRLVVFDLAGEFLRQVGKNQLARPSALAAHGDLLAVAELRARIALLDIDDHVVGHLGDNEEVADTPGWPNSLADDGKFVRQTSLTPGLFNSPHGLAIDAEGNLYVAEWLIGGRYTKLEAAERGCVPEPNVTAPVRTRRY